MILKITVAFYPLTPQENLHNGYRHVFKVNGKPLLLMQEEGKVYILEDICPHKHYPLHNGTCRHGVLRCCYHGWEFNLKTDGSCFQHPNQPGVKLFPVVYENGQVGVDI